MNDNISPELKEVEKEIDAFYLSNQLTKENYSQAVWTLFSVGQDSIFIPTLKSMIDGKLIDRQLDAVMSDRLINGLKHSLNWLKLSCKENGKINQKYIDADYENAKKLLDLGDDYVQFEYAFKLAYEGLSSMHLEGNDITTTSSINKDRSYEAYDRLVRINVDEQKIDYSKFPIQELRDTVNVKSNRFKYPLNPRLLNETIEFIQPLIEPRFALPQEWEFSTFELGHFRKLYEAIFALSYIHNTARFIAYEKDCEDVGYSDCIKIVDYNNLITMLSRYSALDISIVQNILDYLTYGSQNIRNPDPSLQPLFRCNNDICLLMPNLWMAVNPERNLTVLLNRLPTERKIYSKLVNEKENIMKEKIVTTISGQGYRILSGNISQNNQMPDIDLVLIDDKSKILLFIELKWFIEPAEVREILEKSEELQKGINQLLTLDEEYSKSNKQLLDKLKLDNSYKCALVLISSNWIGLSNVQHDKVPIIREDHFLKKLEIVNNLPELISWLENRLYLPVEGEHFEIGLTESQIGKWKLKWSGIRPLVEGNFMPL